MRSDGRPASPELVEQMCRAQRHRGPDSRGIFCDRDASLGIQRLRVIDLQTGDQPIFNEDRSVAVVLNGEIYNFQHLRQDLRRAGHRFATEGDTEVIVHLYEEHGPACVQYLHGMFAFALWDARRRQLLIARDRVGKKPLFYSHRQGALSFASELDALLQDPDIPRDVDHSALDAYLAWGYVPAPMSAFLAVRKLPPATLLLYRDGNVSHQKYWDLDYRQKLVDLGPGELEEQIRAAIRRAVRRRMVADVPMGAFLSGGVDSSAVVAAMSEASPQPVKTFSIGFEEQEFNELPLAREVASQFGTDHHELVVRADAAEILPTVVRHYGEPFADHSAIPCFYLARFARDHVTVALNGDGGDESFAGYQRYTTNLLLAGLDGVPPGARAAADKLARALPGDGDLRSPLSRIKRTAANWMLGREQRYIAQQSIFTAAQRQALYNRDYAAELGDVSADWVIREQWRRSQSNCLLDRMLDVDINSYLPGDLLVKMDISTMAYSLEARSPLLDHEFMELAASVPAERKANSRQRKLALRSALRGWLPDVVLDAPKRGFELPVARWFRTDLRDYAHDVLLGSTSASRGWARESQIRRLLAEHCAERHDHGRAIWTLLMLELWYQQIACAPRARINGTATPTLQSVGTPQARCPRENTPLRSVDKSMPGPQTQPSPFVPISTGHRSPRLRTQTLDPVTDPAWRSFVNVSPDAGIFHRPEWLALLQAQYKYRLFAHVTVNEHGDILAGLPFAQVNSRITGSRLVCVPFSDLCSVATRDRNQAAVQPLIDAVRDQHDHDRVDVEVRDALTGFGTPGASFYHHAVSLAPGVEAVRRGFRSSVRRTIARAERDGVQIVRRTDRKGLDDFYRLHLLTRRHQGIPTQPKQFIRRFSALFEEGLGFVLEARFGRQPIAAAVFLTFNDVITYKYGASLRSHLARRPNNAILMEVIRWGCANGWNTLDLGRTDLDNEGLRSFKRGWGADERVLEYRRLSRRQSAEGAQEIPSVARSLIRHTPPVTSRIVGEALYRHFG